MKEQSSAADMRRQRWQKEVVRWRVADPYVITAAVLALFLSSIGALVLVDRDMRIAELEAQVQRLQGQSQACGVIPEVGSPYIRTHATSQQGPVIYSCH